MKIFKIIVYLVCVAAGLLLLVDSQNGEAGESRVLNIIENDWPPYYFAGKSNKPEGFAKELLKNCIPEKEYSSQFNFYPVKRMYAYLETGKIDIALFSYKKKREAIVHYGKEPIFSSGYRAVVLADSDIQIRDIKDFDKLRIGHLAGLRYSKSFLEYIEKRKEEGTLTVTTLGNSCLKMLLAGMIDVFVDTSDTTLWRAKQMNALDKIRIVDFDIQTKDYFVTVSKQSTVIKDKVYFLEKIDQCVRETKQDGRYIKISEKYGIH